MLILTNNGLSGTISKPEIAALAQLVEQWTENPRVTGSNPVGGIQIKTVTY